MLRKYFFAIFFLLLVTTCIDAQSTMPIGRQVRERISINKGWRYFKYESNAVTDSLMYDVRPAVTDNKDDKVADSKPTEAVAVMASQPVLKPWILPTGNDFIKDPQQRHIRPAGNPGGNFPFVQNGFNDNNWELVNIPHDWAINGPFYEGGNPEVGGGMGRLPVHGVAWYRRKINIPESDAGKSIFLEVDGAMSYSIVWLNGLLVGGWPYGYNSFQLDLTPYIKPGGDNQLSIRLDNPNYSARWYPGGGLYRNIWLTKTNPVHIGQWGTFVTTDGVTQRSANIQLVANIDNDIKSDVSVTVATEVFLCDSKGKKTGKVMLKFPAKTSVVKAGKSVKVQGTVTMKYPKLWGPLPTQQPNQYMAVTTVSHNGAPIDVYETRFGIRKLEFDAVKGLIVNGEPIRFKGVNQHHDLGALGAAFNTRAAERQLEILHELGCNAIRMSHNPPAPELLELTDRMGFLVINEVFDSWERKKTPHDFHLVFPDWSEPDTRAFIRRDRNAPSVIMWSFGNEVGEQYTDTAGAKIAQRLYDIVKEEDQTRPTTTAMNYAKPDMPLPQVPDVISLNYQGEGIRDAPAYAHLRGIRTSPQYPSFHEKFPAKMIVSSESASALSTRGTYIFPVHEGISAPVENGSGGDPVNQFVSSYELYTAQFGASADKVFASQDKHPFVAGEFVWTGWDYIGEPTPYYTARSSYCGMVDLAGFWKDRAYLYQSRWRPEIPMVHILPHWNWPERIGQITPVHIFTSGDEAELFLNGKSMGRKKKAPFEYRLRWDSIQYQPGELRVVAYKNGKKWAENSVKTTGEPAKILAKADRTIIAANGEDLSFITVQVTDKDDQVVPLSKNLIEFSIEGAGEIVATDNGDPASMVSFASHKRAAYNGLCLVIVRSKPKIKGAMVISAKAEGLKEVKVRVIAE